jgi:nucleoid DNA-binding protein
MQKEEKWFDLTELSNRVADTLTSSEAQNLDTPDLVRLVITRAFHEVAKEVGKGERAVILDDIGTFRASLQQARDRQNPQTGETIRKPAHLKFKFKAAKALRQTVQENLPDGKNGMEVK